MVNSDFFYEIKYKIFYWLYTKLNDKAMFCYESYWSALKKMSNRTRSKHTFQK